MRLSTKVATALFCLMAISLTMNLSSQAASGTTQPGNSPPRKIKPDFKPVKIFFDRKCNLKVQVENAGQASFSGNINWYLEVEGIPSSAGFAVVALFPGSKVTKLAVSDALAYWKREKAHDFKIILDKDNKIAESNENNNSMTQKNLICPKYLIRNMKGKLPVTKP